ncbi:MAG: methyl-accepting chemotaxis protein [Acidobacteriaceae bacterium]
MNTELPAAEPQLDPSSDPTMGSAQVKSLLARYVPSIANLSGQLKQTSSQIEQSVMEVCGSFQGMADRAKATVAKATGFLGHGADQAAGKHSFDELIEKTGATLVNIMETVAESGEISRRAVQSIQEIDAASQQISAALGLLEQLAKQNKMLALNARIEAAHAGSQGAGFEVVAIEVASQTQKSREVTNKVGALVENLRSLASAILIDLRQINERDMERVEASQREANESLHDLRAAHEEMKAMLTGMTEEGALLAKDISSAVRGMQFQDRVSQRIAHVVEELDDMRSRLSTGMGAVHLDATAGDSFKSYTMREEREVAGINVAESPAGDVELF